MRRRSKSRYFLPPVIHYQPKVPLHPPRDLPVLLPFHVQDARHQNYGQALQLLGALSGCDG